jgi:hypothetical protein
MQIDRAVEFLKYWMHSSAFQDSLKEQSGGAAIQNVASVGVLKGIRIALAGVSHLSCCGAAEGSFSETPACSDSISFRYDAAFSGLPMAS